jgi:outer membrane receptor protein involved in Fe transport
MKFTLRSASSAAILAGLAGAFPAWAQQAPQTVFTSQVSGPQQTPAAGVDQTPAAGPQTPAAQPERVVVTGSLIAGTPEDAALPVEVYSTEELEQQGSPTALEFAKNLTIAGPTTGESYYFGGVGPGVVSYNLRGLGADKTLSLLNGRRMSENASNVPSAALARTEILKDGAAVTYGADATGGVVNFITRDHFTGLEAQGHYKLIDGSDGDYGLSLLGGFGEGDVNFLWSAEWEHRSRLQTEDRDFAMKSLDRSVNPAPWSSLTNLAGWLPKGALPASPSAGGSFGSGEWGANTNGVFSPIADFTTNATDPSGKGSCEAVGGDPANAYTCYYNYIPYYNLVEDNDIYRAYAQLNARVSDHADFHAEVSFSEVNTPQSFGSPAQPVTRGPALATGATYQFYVPTTNPYAAQFLANAVANGQISAANAANTQGFTPVTYRAFAHGGNPLFGDGNGYGTPSRIDTQQWHISSGLKGDLGQFFESLSAINYDFAVTYNESTTYADAADVIGYRLQQALNGFGGPACNAVDLDPTRFGTQNPGAAGTNGCYYWNPFSTSFASEPELHLSNPHYVVGQENREDVGRWLFDDRASENIDNNLTVDLSFSGQSPITLPGGKIAWAVGAQMRAVEHREVIGSDLYNGNTPCDWPDGTTSQNGVGSPNLESNPVSPTDPNFRGCTPDKPGPFVFFGTNIPDHTDRQQHSFFGELQIPVLDILNFQAAVRREDFSGDLGATVYKVSGKWDVWGPLSIRGSYGTNYQAPPLGIIPGEVTNAVRSYSVAGNNWIGAQFVTDTSISPETAKSWNAGVIWQSQGFTRGSDFQFIVDYFDIQTEDELGQLASPDDIARAVFNGGSATNGTVTTCDPAVQPLLKRVTFNGGCVVGLQAVGGFSTIQTVYGNGPGQHTNGIDIQTHYTFPIGPGDFTASATATHVMKLFNSPSMLDGVPIPDSAGSTTGTDRLGFLNYATVASAAPEWRANFSANYRLENQNFRLGVNYVSAVTDQRPGIVYGKDGEDWITADFTYLFDNLATIRDWAARSAARSKSASRRPSRANFDLEYGNRRLRPPVFVWGT